MSTSTCFHCQLDLPKDKSYTLDIDDLKAYFCCPGCQAVTQTILGLGLKNYYSHRDGPNTQAIDVLPELIQSLEIYDQADMQSRFVVAMGANKEAQIVIKGMHCAACIWLIENRLQLVPGIQELKINLTTHRAIIQWDDEQLKLSQVLQEIYKLGYSASPDMGNEAKQSQVKIRRATMMRLGVAGLGMMQVMMFATALYIGAWSDIEVEHVVFIRWVSWLVATPVLFYAGWPFFQSAFRAIQAKYLNMDVPISLALIATYTASVFSTLTSGKEVYFDSICMFIFFLTLSKFLELSARFKLTSPLSVEDVLPLTVTKLENGKEYTLPLARIASGDTLLIKAGETVPADGIVINGMSTVSESVLTGESYPKSKRIGDNLYTGTQNIDQALIMRASEVGLDTLFSHITRLVEKATLTKPKLLALTHKVASYFVAFVLIMAMGTILFWSQYSWQQAFENTISVLVITCPCALALAIPAVVTRTTYTFMQNGLLIINNHVLEGLNQITDVVFDKTGTLTQGKLTVARYGQISERHNIHPKNIAYQLEQHSEHPVAKAIKDFCKEENKRFTSVENVRSHINQGIEGVIAGKQYRIGKPAFALGLCEKMQADRLSIPNDVQRYCILADKNGAIAWFEILDSLRDDAKLLVQALQKTKRATHILSGDPSNEPQSMQAFLNIDYVRNNASPEDKVAYLEKLSLQSKKVLMIGDGINDAPVLGCAAISIAMQDGSDLAKNSADAILMSNQLKDLISMFAIAKKGKRLMLQNLVWAIGYNAIALPLAVCGYVQPYQAALGMSISSLIVVVNSLRLR
tara:strand:+ start:20996 stop:23410 length:2415 start_codon:yes stop_codon:yes gene_type:complete